MTQAATRAALPFSTPGWRLALPHLAAHVLAGLAFLNPGYIRPDSVGVYSLLRSALLDRDLLFFNEWARFGLIGEGFADFKEVTALGTLANHWGPGTALLSAPFYALAHLVSELLGVQGDGFSEIYAFTLAWTTVLLGFLTSMIAEVLLADAAGVASRSTRLWLVACLWIGTPLFWYEFRFPLGTHVAGAFCVGLFTLFLWRSRREPAGIAAFVTGLALGMAIATRVQHVTLVPAVLAFGLAARMPVRFYRQLIFGTLPPLAVTAATWIVIYGTPFGPLASGANLTGQTWAPFKNVALAEVLFSSFGGLFFWAPLLVLAVVGWGLAWRGTERPLTLAVLAMFLCAWLANGLLDRYFWAGMSFGPRRFLDLAVPFALGLGWFAAFFTPSRSRRLLRLAFLGVLFAAPVLWSAGLAVAALAGGLDLSRYLPAGQIAGIVLAPNWSRTWSLGLARSAFTEALMFQFSALAIAVIAAAALAATAAFRGIKSAALGMTAYLLVSAAGTLLLMGTTRSRAPAEMARFRVDPFLARRLGPLLDQRNLLLTEIDYFERTGNPEKAARTSAEVRAIDDVLGGLANERHRLP